MEELARNFAARAHAKKNQRRKYTDEPYIVHPNAVAALVRAVPHSEAMLCAAWLHDTVEDTDVTFIEILSVFGYEIFRLVYYLTDVSKPEDGNRAIRKMLDREHITRGPVEAKTIKLADLIHNTEFIVKYDRNFARIYLKEKMLLLPGLKEGDPTLWRSANILAIKGLNTLVA